MSRQPRRLVTDRRRQRTWPATELSREAFHHRHGARGPGDLPIPKPRLESGDGASCSIGPASSLSPWLPLTLPHCLSPPASSRPDTNSADSLAHTDAARTSRTGSVRTEPTHEQERPGCKPACRSPADEYNEIDYAGLPVKSGHVRESHCATLILTCSLTTYRARRGSSSERMGSCFTADHGTGGRRVRPADPGASAGRYRRHAGRVPQTWSSYRKSRLPSA
jgi:hypothetical protein